MPTIRPRRRAVAGARLLVPSLCAILLAVTPGVAADAVRAAARGDWIEVRTDHFRVFSNARDAKVRNLVVDLERFRDALGRITRGFDLDDRVPTTMFVFRNEPTYAPYKLDSDGELMNVGGYFQPTPFGNFVTLDLSADSRPMTIVYHEYVHAVMEANIGSLPVWLNEGLAEYFSTFEFIENSRTVEVGHPIEEHIRFLARYGTLDWNEVYATTTDSPTYNEGKRQGAFYAQSWLIVHYLMATDQRAGSFGRLLALLREGRSPDEAMAAALGVDRATLARQVEAYRRTGSGHVWWSLGEDVRQIELETRDVPEPEILFELGNLLAHRGQMPDASRHLEAARAAGYPEGPVEAALGFAAYASDDREEAERRFRAAIAAGVGSPEPYVLLARIVLDRDRAARPEGSDPGRALGEGTREARRLAGSALEIAEDDYHALLTLADTFQLDADPGAGIPAAEKARRRRPTSLDLLELEVCLFAQAGRPREAWYLVTQQLLPLDRETALRAADCYEHGVLLAARRRFDDGGAGAAAAVLDRAVSVMDPREARAVRLRETLERLTAAPERGTTAPTSFSYEIRTERGDRIREQRARYNEAVRISNEGNMAEALPIFEELSETAVDPDIAAEAASAAASLRKAIAARRRYDRLREALTLAREGRAEEAVALLRSLREDVDDPETLRTIDQALDALGGR